MPIDFDATGRSALDLAKACVPEGASLSVGILMDALSQSDVVQTRWPSLAPYLQAPQRLSDSPPERVPVSADLEPVLETLSDRGTPITAEELFSELLQSDGGMEHMVSRGMKPEELNALFSAPGSEPEWKSSRARSEAIKKLSSYGRMLTDADLPDRGMAELVDPFRALMRTMVKRKRRNAIITGYPGTGKTALVYDLARKLRAGDDSVPAQLRDHDVFELSPSFLRSGASVVGEYDERVKALIEVLTANPKIILFVDEIHSLFQSGMHNRGPFSDANEAFKGVLGRGEITVIGCTTISEYRHHIAPDQALTRRFTVIRIEPPSAKAAQRILQARHEAVQRHYAPLRIPQEILSQVVELSEDFLPGRYQPDKSIQLLEEACAHCTVSTPPLEEVSPEAVWVALETLVGHKLVRTERLKESEVIESLQAKILGQDEAVEQVARAVISGLGDWSKKSSPRVVFLFGGPTGVGKTETALILSKIVGGERDSLLRVDCNLLQGSGHDSGTITNRLLGVPPGYVGYARGEGGILSRIRDLPEAVVLFDEIEKADPSVGKLLLQIMDDGRIEDSDGNQLDFRRSFLIFTTNAGFGTAVGQKRQLGFRTDERASATMPKTDTESMKAALRFAGFADEFLGRISHFIMFNELDQDSIRRVIRIQITKLEETATAKGLQLEWDDEIIEHIAAQWLPRFGVRHLTTILRNRVVEQLSVAEAQGEMDGVARVRLTRLGWEGSAPAEGLTGLATRDHEGETLIIRLG